MPTVIRDPLKFERCARESWDALVARDNPARYYDIVEQMDPEIVRAHHTVIAATLKADFNAEKAQKLINPKIPLDQLPSGNPKYPAPDFRRQLADFLRAWVARHGT